MKVRMRPLCRPGRREAQRAAESGRQRRREIVHPQGRLGAGDFQPDPDRERDRRQQRRARGAHEAGTAVGQLHESGIDTDSRRRERCPPALNARIGPPPGPPRRAPTIAVVFGRTNFQLARVFGIRIGVGISWFVLLFILIFVLTPAFHTMLGGSRTTAYVVAVASVLSFFVSIILHELGHALVARRSGMTVGGIDLWALGGITRTSDSRTPGAEARVAAAGPLVTFAADRRLRGGRTADRRQATTSSKSRSPAPAYTPRRRSCGSAGWRRSTRSCCCST